MEIKNVKDFVIMYLNGKTAFEAKFIDPYEFVKKFNIDESYITEIMELINQHIRFFDNKYLYTVDEWLANRENTYDGKEIRLLNIHYSATNVDAIKRYMNNENFHDVVKHKVGAEYKPYDLSYAIRWDDKNLFNDKYGQVSLDEERDAEFVCVSDPYWSVVEKFDTPYWYWKKFSRQFIDVKSLKTGNTYRFLYFSDNYISAFDSDEIEYRNKEIRDLYDDLDDDYNDYKR